MLPDYDRDVSSPLLEYDEKRRDPSDCRHIKGKNLDKSRRDERALRSMIHAIGTIYEASFDCGIDLTVEPFPVDETELAHWTVDTMREEAMCLDPLHPFNVSDRLERVIAYLISMRNLIIHACNSGEMGLDDRWHKVLYYDDAVKIKRNESNV